jgi:hypothetical protein
MTRGAASHRRAHSEGLTVEVPLTFRKRGGRKQMIMPDGNAVPACARNAAVSGSGNATLIRALARAHRWREMLEGGSFNSITELADAEGVNRSYVCRILRLTLLAPAMTCAILNDQAGDVSVQELVQPVPALWSKQGEHNLI